MLDALAIAAQVMVGRMLGAGDAAGARAAAGRMIVLSALLGAAFGLVLLALGDAIPRLFTPDAAVVAQAHEIWWLFAALMPLNGAVFALDGILIGAGDTRFLMWGMLAASAVYIPVALLALDRGWGIMGVWWGLAALIAVRLATCGLRFASNRWALTGALPCSLARMRRLAAAPRLLAARASPPRRRSRRRAGRSRSARCPSRRRPRPRRRRRTRRSRRSRTPTARCSSSSAAGW